jgi:hypothetical protein
MQLNHMIFMDIRMSPGSDMRELGVDQRKTGAQ